MRSGDLGPPAEQAARGGATIIDPVVGEDEAVPEDVTEPEDLPEPEIDLTEVLSLLEEQIPSGAKPDIRSSADVSGVSAIRMRATDTAGTGDVVGTFYLPAILVGEPGQTLTLVVSNTGSGSHTFTVPEWGIDLMVPLGKTATVEVTFPDDGEPVVFACTLHRDLRGHVGALVAST